MECSCACDWWDGPPVLMYTERWPRARVEHRCCECGEVISVGDTYHWQKYLCDGVWHENKTCRPCKSIRDDFAPCAIPGEMAWEVEDCLGFDIFAPVERWSDG
jgi:hypothetical protein